MTKAKRVREIFIGMLMIAAAVLIMHSPRNGYPLIITALAVWFVIRGIYFLIYFFTMSRFMVGGRVSLYMAIFLIDLGALAGSLTDVPHYYILLYLIGLHAFSGLVEIVRALEQRRVGAPSYRLKLTHGALDLLMALICIIFIRHLGTAVLIYGVGLIYSAILRIVSACRKNKYIYIPQ